MKCHWIIKHKGWYRAREIDGNGIVGSTDIKRAIKYKTKEEAEKIWPNKKEIIELSGKSKMIKIISPENITRRQAKKLVKLLEKEIRYEIMARYGEWGETLEFVDYKIKQEETRKKIHKLLYGTSNLVELGNNWKMINTRKRKIKKKLKD